MEFIIDEAEIANDLYSSDESDKECSSSDDFLTDDKETVEENDVNFYRSFENREEFHKFKNQIKSPGEEHQKSETELFYGDNDLPEMFLPEDREHVEFDISDSTKERAGNFKKTLKCFKNDSIKNHFYYSVVYGLMSHKTKKPELDLAQEILGKDFF